jgi:hypothetical protein
MQRESFFGVNYLLAILFFTNAAITSLTSLKSFADHKGVDRKLLIDWYLIFWAVFAYISAAYSGRHFGHYYIITLAPLCLICAATVHILFDASDSRLMPASHKHTSAGLNKSFSKIFLIVTVFLGLFSPLRLYASRIRQWRVRWQKDARKDSLSQPLYELSEYIKLNSGRQEKIFVWGFSPEIYVLTDRMPAARYTHCNFLTGMIPWTNWQPGVDTSNMIVPGAWKIFMEEIERNKPK